VPDAVAEVRFVGSAMLNRSWLADRQELGRAISTPTAGTYSVPLRA